MIFFIPTSIIAIIVNWKNKNIDIRATIVVILFGICGAIIGTKIANNLNVLELKKYFGFFLLVMSIIEIYNLKKEYRNYKNTDNK